jgi:hypothetical protein
MRSFLIAPVAALVLLAGGHWASAQDKTDPAHPLANPQAPAPDCRSDSIRGGNLPCGPGNRLEPSGTTGAKKQGQ